MVMPWIRHAEAMVGVATLCLAACSDVRSGEMDALSGGTDSGQQDSTSTGDVDPTPASTGGPQGCQSDADCQGDPDGSFCDTATGTCFPECAPEQTRPCYSGPEGTEGVGACTAGVNVCTADGTWNLWCEGEVVPASNDCDDNGADDDCDGLVDDTDNDGDGFGACTVDCCDQSGANCSDAALVNPGAFEVEGNQLDDDCDGMIDEPAVDCDDGLASDSSDPFDYARALDLCTTTVESPADPADKTWGVIEASLTLADGGGQPMPVQRAIRPDFGDLVTPEHGASMVVLSSGHAADATDTSPDFAPFQGGIDLGTEVAAPTDWLTANGGTFPNPAGCLEPWDADANDSVMLTLRMRAPTNARSFSARMFFFSAEYPEWVCSEFNDFFVTLVDSAADNPADGNIAIYDDDGTVWPVGVNLVMVTDGLFTQCENGEVGCARNLGTDYQGCVGNNLVAGSGFDLPDDGCGGEQSEVGGGTGWLEMSGNVEPGEVFEVRFAIWDTSGHIFDSLVLLDDWTWSVDAATPGVAPG